MAIEHPDHQDVNSLGELPQETRQERGERYTGEVYPQGPPGILTEIPGAPRPAPLQPPLMPMPTDVRGQNAMLEQAQRTPIGLPSVDYLIQSTFDARPINGNDWTFLNVLALDVNGDVGTPVTSAVVSFKVPDGRVAIIRDFNWRSTQLLATPNGNIEPGEDISDYEPVFVTLSVSGFVQRTYERIYSQVGEREVYAIGFEKETIDVRVTFNPNWGGSTIGWQPGFYIEMNGNLLDTRGREKQYEPANEYGSGGVLK